MTKTATDTLALKMHVTNDKVWYIDRDIDYPRCSGQSPAEFLASSKITADTHVRIIGSAVNVKMIVQLYDLKQKERIANVEVCTPLVCRTAKNRKNPEAVLMAMRQFQRAASVGGFHEVTEHDYRAYALANAIYMHVQDTHGNSVVGAAAQKLLRQHPAWHALSFIPGIDTVAVAGLLGYLLDPRWFVDECSPDGAGKMFEWLGLSPRTQAGVSGTRPPWRHHKRCQLVLSCWKNNALEADIRDRFEISKAIPVADCDLRGWHPHDFIWRTWGARLQLGVTDAIMGDPVVADLRASQRFISFLRFTWLSALYKDTRALPDQRAPLFRPADFFKNPLEVAAYEQHQLKGT